MHVFNDRLSKLQHLIRILPCCIWCTTSFFCQSESNPAALKLDQTKTQCFLLFVPVKMALIIIISLLPALKCNWVRFTLIAGEVKLLLTFLESKKYTDVISLSRCTNDLLMTKIIYVRYMLICCLCLVQMTPLRRQFSTSQRKQMMTCWPAHLQHTPQKTCSL